MSSDAQPNRTSSFDDTPDGRAARSFEVMLRVPDLSRAVADDASSEKGEKGVSTEAPAPIDVAQQPDPPAAVEDSPSVAATRSASDGRNPENWLEVVRRATVHNQLRRSALLATGVLIVLVGGYFAFRANKGSDPPSTESDATQWVGLDDSQWRGLDSTPDEGSAPGDDFPFREQSGVSEPAPIAERTNEESSLIEDPSFDPLVLGHPEVSIDPSAARLYARFTSNPMIGHSYPVTVPGTFRFARSDALSRESAEYQRTVDTHAPHDGNAPQLESRLEGRIEHLPLR